MKIAIIPARGGSQRIPNKNIKKFCGKPIISWSIKSAKKSKLFDRIIVSTDSKKIAKVALNEGAEVPFIRSKELSDNYTNTREVIADTIIKIGRKNKKDFICCIFATAPFTTVNDLKKTFNIVKNKNCKYVFPITNYQYPIQRGIKLKKNNYISMINHKNFNKRSQDLKEMWHDAGQFLWAKSKFWLSKEIVFSNKSIGYPISNIKAYDIDNLEDWKIAEVLFKLHKKSL